MSGSLTHEGRKLNQAAHAHSRRRKFTHAVLTHSRSLTEFFVSGQFFYCLNFAPIFLGKIARLPPFLHLLAVIVTQNRYKKRNFRAGDSRRSKFHKYNNLLFDGLEHQIIILEIRHKFQATESRDN